MRRPHKEDVKLRTISNPFEAPRGVQPIRQYFKVDESKLLWSERFGIDVNNNNDEMSCGKFCLFTLKVFYEFTTYF